MVTTLPCKPPTVEQVARVRNNFLLILGITSIVIVTFFFLKKDLQAYLVLTYTLIVCLFFVAALIYAFKVMDILSVFKWILGITVISSVLLTWSFLPQEAVSLFSYLEGCIAFCAMLLCAYTLGMSISILQIVRKLDEKRVQQVYQATEKSNVIYEYVELIKGMSKREFILLDYAAVFNYLDDNEIDYSDIVPDE